MSEPVQCERKGKWIRGCRFEARYNTSTPRALTVPELAEIWPSDIPETLRAMRPKRYVGDVCVTCGHTIKRVPSPAPTGEETA